jgi:hypothetical protein
VIAESLLEPQQLQRFVFRKPRRHGASLGMIAAKPNWRLGFCRSWIARFGAALGFGK